MISPFNFTPPPYYAARAKLAAAKKKDYGIGWQIPIALVAVFVVKATIFRLVVGWWPLPI